MGIGHWTERSASFAAVLLLVAIAWGALAFGAVYPWAYWPLALLSVVASVIGPPTFFALRGRGLSSDEAVEMSLELALPWLEHRRNELTGLS